MSTITELFQRDPLKMTTEDIDLIIAEMRKKRALFNSGKLTEKKPTKLTEGQQQAAKLSLDFEL